MPFANYDKIKCDLIRHVIVELRVHSNIIKFAAVPNKPVITSYVFILGYVNC